MRYTFFADSSRQGKKLERFLRDENVSLALIKKIKFTPRGIQVNGIRQNTDYTVKAGDTVSFDLDSRRKTDSVAVQYGSLEIVYEDDGCMVVNKGRNMPCHPSFNHHSGTLLNYLRGYARQKGNTFSCHILNRLDRNTSGLVLVAKDSHCAQLLSGKNRKEYIAVVQGILPRGDGKIDLPIGRREGSIIKRQVREDGRRAVTLYKSEKTGGGHSLVRVRLITGRTHQIRVHFSHLGYPLAGDDLYGGSLRHISRQALHCSAMSFKSPATGENISLTAPLPEDMAALARLMQE